MAEKDATFKRLVRHKKKIVALKCVRKMLNDKIRELEEKVTNSLTQYVNRDKGKFWEYEGRAPLAIRFRWHIHWILMMVYC
jgi:hypothetical protein